MAENPKATLPFFASEICTRMGSCSTGRLGLLYDFSVQSAKKWLGQTRPARLLATAMHCA